MKKMHEEIWMSGIVSSERSRYLLTCLRLSENSQKMSYTMMSQPRLLRTCRSKVATWKFHSHSIAMFSEKCANSMVYLRNEFEVDSRSEWKNIEVFKWFRREMHVRQHTVRPTTHRSRRCSRSYFGFQRQFQRHMNHHGVGFQKIWNLKKSVEGPWFIIVHIVNSNFLGIRAKNKMYTFLVWWDPKWWEFNIKVSNIWLKLLESK